MKVHVIVFQIYEDLKKTSGVCKGFINKARERSLRQSKSFLVKQKRHVSRTDTFLTKYFYIEISVLDKEIP